MPFSLDYLHNHTLSLSLSLLIRSHSPCLCTSMVVGAPWRGDTLNIYLSLRTTAALHVGEQPVGRSANVKRWKWFPCEGED